MINIIFELSCNTVNIKMVAFSINKVIYEKRNYTNTEKIE